MKQSNTETNKPMPTPTTPKPRVLDPEIQKLREAHKANVANLQFERRSTETVNRIIKELLPKLIPSHKAALSSQASWKQREIDELNGALAAMPAREAVAA